MFLLEQDITRKRRANKTTSQMESERNDDNKNYEVEAICDSEVYTKESNNGHLPGLYHLIFWKSYLKEKNT